MSKHTTIIYDDGVAVTASDTVNDPKGPFAGFHTGSGGTVRVITLRGRDLTLGSLPAGVVYPLGILRVFVATTSATGVLGMYEAGYKGPPATT